MNEFAADWLERLRPYFADYGWGIVLGVLFLKNLLFFGAVLPGAALLVAAGWFARQGQGSLVPLALCAFAGTVAGDAVSYLIGRRAAAWLLRSHKWGKTVAALAERVRDEPALFVFCHFQTALRMFVPAAAGISGVPFGRWMTLTAIGAAIWVACYVGAGYLLSLAGALAAGKTAALGVVGLLFVVIVGRHLYRQTRRPEPAAGAEEP